MLENFFAVLNGDCIFLTNYHGESLKKSMVVNLVANMAVITARTEFEADSEQGANQDIRVVKTHTLSVGSKKFCFVSTKAHKDKLYLCVQGSTGTADSFLNLYIEDILTVLYYYLGGFVEKVDVSDIHTALEVGHHMFTMYDSDLTYLVHGVRWISIEESKRAQCDKILAALEEVPGVKGSALVLGASIVHSRLGYDDTRILLHNLQYKLMGTARIRITPIYSEGAWKQIVYFSLRKVTLATLISVDADIDHILSEIQKVDDTIITSNINIPANEPNFNVRSFSTDNIIAFVFKHRRTGKTIAPEVNGSNESEMFKLNDAFVWFHSRACDVLRQTRGNASIVLKERVYQFYAERTDLHELYVMYEEYEPYPDVIAMKDRLYESLLVRSPDLQLDMD